MNQNMDSTLLVADDEPLVRRTLARALAGEARGVLTAASGDDAVRLATERVPDLILLDVHMPGGGMEALRRLRQDPRTRLIPVILVTGDASHELHVGGLNDGADDYILKPFDLGELRARVRAVMRRSTQAISASPLSRLPGAAAVEEEVRQRIAEERPFAFLYADIDRFKSFNDRYGYARGDALILNAASLLTACARPGDLAAHIGGDDFVLVCEPERAEAAAHAFAIGFDAAAASHYDEEDAARGYVEGLGRQGVPVRCGLVTLSVAGMSPRLTGSMHYGGIVDAAARFKQTLKSLPQRGGSVYGFIEGRP